MSKTPARQTRAEIERRAVRTRFLVGSICILCALVVCLTPRLDAQTGRATITGAVTDPTGAAIPGASVVAVQTETKVEYRTAANETGYYTLPSLPISQYAVTFSAAGFRELVRSGISLESGQAARIDAVLQLGPVTEKVTVAAEAAIIQTETAQASKTIDAKVYASLALPFSQRGRDVTNFAIALVPGVQNGPQGVDMRVEGTPGATQAVVVDGMNVLSGRIASDFAEASISPEAIQEVTMFTGNADAEFGRAAGGALNLVLKSGTNRFHGTGFGYLRNEVLNANDWNNNRMLAADPDFKNPQTRSFLRPQSRQNTEGFSFGGPVWIPKVYRGQNRTFFFLSLEKFKQQQSGPTTLTATVPQPEMWDGDFSKLLTGRLAGTDALGRPAYQGQIYDPATLRQVNGQYVADPFLGNIIPASRISRVARNLKSVFAQYYPPATNSLQNNVYGTRYVDAEPLQLSVKLDHAFSAAHKLSGLYYLHDSPRWLPVNGTTPLWSLADPTRGGPLAAIRNQYLHGNNWNVSEDWIISPSLLNHISYGQATDRVDNINGGTGKGLAEQWGITGVGLGLPKDQVSAPVFQFASSSVMSISNWGYGQMNTNSFTNHIASDTLHWQRGSHSLKAGVEWMRMTAWTNDPSNSGGIFGLAPRTTGIPGQSYSSLIGNSFASLLLGAVNNASINVSTNPQVRRDAIALFVQDDWKITRRLTLNLGLRWNGDSPVYESQDRIANFNPNLPDPNANNMPGAVEYMGYGQGRAGKRSPAPGYYKNFGPVFGLAYQVKPRAVLRASYSVTYTPESIATVSQFGVLPGAFSAGLAQTNAVPADSKGIYLPVFNIDNGYPGTTQPVNLDPSWGQKQASTMISPDLYKAGYVQHFHAGMQFQPTSNLSVETSWRAAKGTRLHAGDNVLPNQLHPQDLSRGAVLGQVISSPQQASAAGLPYPYAGWSGVGANTLEPFPQIKTMGLSAWGDPVGFSTYESGNLIVTKRTSRGLTAYGAYTFAKSITNVTEIIGSGDSTGFQDTYNRSLYKTIDPNDRTHVLKASILWELPVGRGKPLLGRAGRLVNGILGGWSVSALLGYSSGTPLGHPTSRVQPVGWNGPAAYANFNAAGNFTRVFDPSKFNPWNPSDPGNRFFDPKAFSDALPQQLGNSPVRFPQVRMPWGLNEDGSIMKRFPIAESAHIEFRAEFFNFLNRHHFGAPDMNMNDPQFGNIWQASGSRSGQAGIRVEW